MQYICIYVCIYVCVCVCIYIYIYICTYIHMYIHIHTHKFITLCRTVLPLCMAIFLTLFGEICMVLHNNT